jgi:hypothetical protein
MQAADKPQSALATGQVNYNLDKILFGTRQEPVEKNNLLYGSLHLLQGQLDNTGSSAPFRIVAFQLFLGSRNLTFCVVNFFGHSDRSLNFPWLFPMHERPTIINCQHNTN